MQKSRARTLRARDECGVEGKKKLKLENYSKNSSHIISHFLHIRTDIYEGRRKVFLAFLSVVAAAIRAKQNNNTNTREKKNENNSGTFVVGL